MSLPVRVRKKLFCVGALPMASYHMKVWGCSPTEMSKLRAMAHHAVCAGNIMGRSATVDLALQNGARRDPSIGQVIDLCREWLRWWSRATDQRVRISKAWFVVRRRMQALEPAKRWRKVKGPIAAVINTLLQIGWSPDQPAKWVDAEGLVWQVVEGSSDCDEFFHKIAEDCSKKLCRSVASGHNGAGCEHGIDFWSHKALVTKLVRKQQFADAGTLRMIAAGGLWGADRIARAVEDEAVGVCDLCGEPDTDLHRLWTCPCIKDAISQCTSLSNESKERYLAAIDKSEKLKSDAVK
eukprot:11932301-Karenia_brevis.AAC.1